MPVVAAGILLGQTGSEEECRRNAQLRDVAFLDKVLAKEDW
jgi:hypothetical protein